MGRLVKGFKDQKLIRKFTSYPKEVEQRIQQAAIKTAYEINREQKTRAKVKTGFMRANIVVIIKKLGAVLRSRASYSSFLNWGTAFIKADFFFTGPIERKRPIYLRRLKRALKSR